MRQQEKKATQCSASQSSGLFYQGSLGGIFPGHLRGPGSQAGHEEKKNSLKKFFFKEALKCLILGWGPARSPQVICVAELGSLLLLS